MTRHLSKDGDSRFDVLRRTPQFFGTLSSIALSKAKESSQRHVDKGSRRWRKTANPHIFSRHFHWWIIASRLRAKVRKSRETSDTRTFGLTLKVANRPRSNSSVSRSPLRRENIVDVDVEMTRFIARGENEWSCSGALINATRRVAVRNRFRDPAGEIVPTNGVPLRPRIWFIIVAVINEGRRAHRSRIARFVEPLIAPCAGEPTRACMRARTALVTLECIGCVAGSAFPPGSDIFQAGEHHPRFRLQASGSPTVRDVKEGRQCVKDSTIVPV
jgi:hypothetical protein